MTLLELLDKRRSVRKYKNSAIEADVVKKLIKATLTAPSSKNCRSTRLAIIENRAVLEQLSTMRSSGAGLLKDAPMAIAVMADSSQTDLWRENCAISATVLQLAAESMGLGSCWVHVYGRHYRDDNPTGKSAEDYVHEVAPGTRPYNVMCVVALGYPDAESKSHPEREDADKIIYI